MSLPCSLVYWPMRRTSAQSEWRAHPRGSALTRLGGCVHSMPDQRPTARRKRASPMPTPSIRIPSFGAMAQRHRQMANSSARATELQSAETSIALRQRTRISPTESEAAYVLDGLLIRTRSSTFTGLFRCLRPKSRATASLFHTSLCSTFETLGSRHPREEVR